MADFCLLFYRVYLRGQFGFACRFEPSCSCYARQSIQVHGIWRGSWLTIWRLLSCQPFSRGGFDPVPMRRDINGQ